MPKMVTGGCLEDTVKVVPVEMQSREMVDGWAWFWQAWSFLAKKSGEMPGRSLASSMLKAMATEAVAESLGTAGVGGLVARLERVLVADGALGGGVVVAAGLVGGGVGAWSLARSSCWEGGRSWGKSFKD